MQRQINKPSLFLSFSFNGSCQAHSQSHSFRQTQWKLSSSLRLRLDWAEKPSVYVWCFSFLFFIFFFSRVCETYGYCSWIVAAKFDFSHSFSANQFALFTNPQISFLATFSLKMGHTVLFTHLKIILLQWFQQ